MTTSLSAISRPSPEHPSSPGMRGLLPRCLVGTVMLALAVSTAQAATPLADQPLALSSGVPGNLALPLSVEYPTAVSVAHPDNTYAPASTYLGYFDPDKCYVYKFVDVESTTTSMSHFAPAGVAASHTCVGANDYMWSGNYMNWATMQTIDPFRWVLTGGYRVLDLPGLTLLEKAWASGQGGTGNFPNRTLSSPTDIANATPFTDPTALTTYVSGFGQLAIFAATNNFGSGGFLGTYFKGSSLDSTGNTPVLTRTETINYPNWGTNNSPSFPLFGNGEVFSARWVSNSNAPSTGNYQFQVYSDDSSTVWVNGSQVLQIAGYNYTPITSASIALTAGQALNVRVEYVQGGGAGAIVLSWKPPGASSFTPYPGGISGGGAVAYWNPPVRVRVCDATAPAAGTQPNGAESNCKAYASGFYKPEGLMQQYASKIRYSVLGYLNDSNLLRDAGVLRAQQKFIGPTYPVPGLPDAANAAAEWSGSTGVYVTNPDNITTTLGGNTISNSGVVNYLNKFGEITRGNYKTYDPVSELYYATLRYYKNLPPVPEWTAANGADGPTQAVWADGFPVITSGIADPILYSCQKNFILGIGDVNTHADKNVPGPTTSNNEPTPKPPLVVNDPTYSGSINAVTTTNQVGVLEGLGASLGTVENYNGCCNNNSALMAGLAYDANIRDIRTGLANVNARGQTVQTYWMDVLEFQTYKPNNQYYLATKYGGFKVPDSYNAGDPLQTAWWNTTTDTVGSGASAQPRPDNYFTAGRPDQVVSGLTAAFASIAAQSSAVVASNAIPLPQVASGGGNVSYAASWDGSGWTGELIANELTYSGTSLTPTLTPRWTLSAVLAAQLTGTGWDTNRRVASWNTTSATGVPFRSASLSTTQNTALVPTYVGGVTASAYVGYLRGDRTLEGSKLRIRGKLLGDIVDGKPIVVGPPSLPFSDSTNPGYSAFKTAQASRQSMVYVGSNDGMMHGINGSLTGTDAGKELFAYIPGALAAGPSGTPSVDGLASLGNPAFTHHYMVDSAPIVYDIDMGNTFGSSTGTSWKSVLIGGLGKGGKSYYALDVTDPNGMIAGGTIALQESNLASKVLWEFSDSRLGFTYGQAAVVKTRQHGWVVIVPSGYNNSDGKGYIFVLNARTGALIQALATGVGSASGSPGDAGLAQLNAFILDRTDGTADAAYAGDLLGNVWRLDLTTASGAYPGLTKLATVTDPGGTTQPITSRPLIEIQPVTNRRFVLFGTGRLLAPSDIASTQGQTYYAVADGNNARFNSSANLPTGVTFPVVRSNLVANTNPAASTPVTYNPNTQMGCYIDLSTSGDTGWRVVADSTTFFGTVSFVSSKPTGDACSSSGTSRVYSTDFCGNSQLLDTDGVSLSQYLQILKGNVNGLQDTSVSGTHQLIVGTDDGKLKVAPTKPTPTPTLRRLNWREVPVAN